MQRDCGDSVKLTPRAGGRHRMRGSCRHKPRQRSSRLLAVCDGDVQDTPGGAARPRAGALPPVRLRILALTQQGARTQHLCTAVRLRSLHPTPRRPDPVASWPWRLRLQGRPRHFKGKRGHWPCLWLHTPCGGRRPRWRRGRPRGFSPQHRGWCLCLGARVQGGDSRQAADGRMSGELRHPWRPPHAGRCF